MSKRRYQSQRPSSVGAPFHAPQMNITCRIGLFRSSRRMGRVVAALQLRLSRLPHVTIPVRSGSERILQKDPPSRSIGDRRQLRYASRTVARAPRLHGRHVFLSDDRTYGIDGQVRYGFEIPRRLFFMETILSAGSTIRGDLLIHVAGFRTVFE